MQKSFRFLSFDSKNSIEMLQLKVMFLIKIFHLSVSLALHSKLALMNIQKRLKFTKISASPNHQKSHQRPL